MSSRRYTISRILTNRPLTFHCLSSPFKWMLVVLTHYYTPKMVRFESKWIARLSLFVKLSLAISCICLLFQQTSYQVVDRSPISAVIIEIERSDYCSRNSSIMEHFKDYDCSQSSYGVYDFILPPTENSAVSIITRTIETEHVLRECNKSVIKKEKIKCPSFYATSLHKCFEISRCILPPHYRHEYENNTINENNTIKNKTELCWFKLPLTHVKRNYQALDYKLFIKNYVEFPTVGLIRLNIKPEIVDPIYTATCEYDPIEHPLCPKFRILKILQMIEDDITEYESMFFHGALIEIKIIWRCNLDKHIKFCKPLYEFKRLDYKPYKDNPYEPGSRFLTARHYFAPDGRELHRVHTEIYTLHILVSVTGEVGKFSLFETTTSIGSYIGILGSGTIACDLIAAFITNFRRVKYGD